MFPKIATSALNTPSAWFMLVVQIVLLGLFLALAWWVLKTFIMPYVPEPFKWVINILIGLALLGLLFFLFFGV